MSLEEFPLHVTATIDRDLWALGRATVISRRDGTSHWISLFGEIDLSCKSQLTAVLRRAERTDVESIVVDLSGLDFIDSAGAAVLVDAYRRCPSRLLLVRGPGRVHRVFELTKLDRVLPFAAE